MDRLSALPTEILFKIVENVIPKERRMIIGYEGLGTSATGIQRGRLNILRVSKLVSAIALEVLYSYRHYELAVETDLHRRIAKDDFILTFFVCGTEASNDSVRVPSAHLFRTLHLQYALSTSARLYRQAESDYNTYRLLSPSAPPYASTIVLD